MGRRRNKIPDLFVAADSEIVMLLQRHGVSYDFLNSKDIKAEALKMIVRLCPSCGGTGISLLERGENVYLEDPCTKCDWILQHMNSSEDTSDED